MKPRYLLIVLVLLGVAAFLLFQKNGTGNGAVGDADQKERDSNSTARSSGDVADGGSGSGSGRREKSDRVLRDEPAIVTTESGLKYEILVEGQGERPSPKSMVEVHYVGTLDDGTVFDSSRARGQSAKFGLHQVIKGWTEGLQLMRTGGHYRFTIPPELGYGAGREGGQIPPNSTLIFEVELLGVEDE